MRDYAKISPRFWTGSTGKKVRALGPEVAVVALYLLSCPTSNMIGLYYLPLPVLAHETGIPFEGASKALRSLSEAHFAHYDEHEEMVWVPEMARHQIAEELKPGDLRCKGIWREAEQFRKSRFYMDFWNRYHRVFHLPDPSPFEAPSKPLRSQEQEQEQDRYRHASPAGAAPVPEPPKPAREENPAAEEGRAKVLEVWEQVAVPAGLPAVLKFDARRKQAVNARLKDSAWLELFREAVSYAALSPGGAWMRGGGDRAWKATLDYFLKPGNVEKAVEKARASPGKVSPLRPASASPQPSRFPKIARVETS